MNLTSMLGIHWLCWALAVLCLATWGLAVILVKNLAQLGRLADLPLPDVGDRSTWPKVSVIIPAANEADTLGPAMRKRLEDDYPNLELIVVNDRSMDGTGAVAEQLAATDPRVRVVHLTEVPAGWLGKLNALAEGVRQSDGEWVLISDADVTVAPGSLARAVHHCQRHGFDVLAALPTITPTGGVVSRIVLAGLHAELLRVLYAAMTVRAVEDPRRSAGIGVGAFTLVRRSALERSPGFEAIRLEVADDLMLGRLLKQSGARCTALNGDGALGVAIYPRVRDFVTGAEKNAWGVSAGFSFWRGLAVALAVLVADLAPLGLPLAAALGGSPWMLGFGVASAGCALGVAMLALWANGRAPWGGVIYWVGALVFFVSAVRGTWRGWRRGGLLWRGTLYPTRVFRAFRRERRRGHPR